MLEGEQSGGGVVPVEIYVRYKLWEGELCEFLRDYIVLFHLYYFFN